MKRFLIIVLICATLSGCVTFGFQKNKQTGDYNWQSIGWMGMGGTVTPLIKFEGGDTHVTKISN